SACFARLLALTAAEMNRQSDHDAANLFFLDQFQEELRVACPATAPVGCQRRGDAPVRIADRQPDADAALVDPQQPTRTHRYFSSPFCFSRSTSCFTVPSSRRSATSTASPSWMMSRFSTPIVAMSWPLSATMTQFFVFSPQWVPSTVLPSASCGFM